MAGRGGGSGDHRMNRKVMAPNGGHSVHHAQRSLHKPASEHPKDTPRDGEVLGSQQDQALGAYTWGRSITSSLTALRDVRNPAVPKHVPAFN